MSNVEQVGINQWVSVPMYLLQYLLLIEWKIKDTVCISTAPQPEMQAVLHSCQPKTNQVPNTSVYFIKN